MANNITLYIKCSNYRSAVRDMRAENRGCLFSDERGVQGSEVSTTHNSIGRYTDLIWK